MRFRNNKDKITKRKPQEDQEYKGEPQSSDEEDELDDNFDSQNDSFEQEVQSNPEKGKRKSRNNTSKPKKSKRTNSLTLSKASLPKNVGKKQAVKKASRKKDKSASEDSQHSDILEIRDMDDNLREFVRPEFLRRWDGKSNQLQLTEAELDGMSPMMSVYWLTKSKNMKAVVFLMLGKVQFFAFENDALLLNDLFKKKIKRFSKFLMVNFWYREIQSAKRELYARKIPVLIMNEVDDEQYRQQHGIVKRVVQEVITPAIHPKVDTAAAARERLLLVVYRLAGTFSYLVLDGQTNEFLIDEIAEDPNYHQTRRILNRYRPVELVVPRNGHDEVVQIARQICDPYVVELRLSENMHVGEFLESVAQSTNSPVCKKLHRDFMGQGQQEGTGFRRYRTVMAIKLIEQYLQDLSMKEKIFNQGLFTQDNSESFRAPFFDSQVYQNLQLFRLRLTEQDTYCKPGTLLHYVDHCKTQQGRKMVHKWLDCPPSLLLEVLERQKAILELVEDQTALKLHERMFAFEKLGKKLADIYHWMERQSQRGKILLSKHINFEKEYDVRKNPAVMRIRELLEVVRYLKEYENFLKDLSKSGFKSELLQANTTIHQVSNLTEMEWEELDAIKGLPQIAEVTDLIFKGVVYDEYTGNIEPQPGECDIYDSNKRQFQRIRDDLEKELDKWKEFFDSSRVKYVSARAKNEIEVPKQLIKKKEGKGNPHKDLIFSSEISGAIRYVTAESSGLSMELVEAQQAMAQSYEPFLQKLLLSFSKYRGLWDRFVKSSAWIDALMSLAETSKRMGLRCLPQFREGGLRIEGAFHPSLTQILPTVIPNNLTMEAEERVLLLTGPNMGGKSTLLKQTCLLVILAQLGCLVPAKSYSAPIFDQIFCRIGASDRILEGKSTFYVELEETKRIITKANHSSLVVIDELGRGTSTFDGMAIAEAILNQLLNMSKPITLFSTHYTQISQRYVSNPKVKLAKMGYQIEEEGMVFTYQLEPGVAEKSFAGNVAQLVRIPRAVLDIATQKSQEIHHQIRKKKLLRNACDFGGLLKIDRQLMKVTASSTFESVKGLKEGKRTTDKRQTRRGVSRGRGK